MKAPRETVAFVPCIRVAVGKDKRTTRPDYLASVDVDPASKTYGKVVSRLEMPHPGDELHGS
jgi:selenium-binding protein 1